MYFTKENIQLLYRYFDADMYIDLSISFLDRDSYDGLGCISL